MYRKLTEASVPVSVRRVPEQAAPVKRRTAGESISCASRSASAYRRTTGESISCTSEERIGRR